MANDIHPDNDWVFFALEEVAGYNENCIMFILGPNEVTHHFQLCDIPGTSQLLLRLNALPQRQRYIRLPTLDLNMVDAYCQPHSSNSLTNHSSWLQVIKLAITADTLQDYDVEFNAVAALRRKGEAAEKDRKTLYSHQDYAFVRNHLKATGGGEWVMAVLDTIAQTVDAKTRLLDMPLDRL